MDCLNNNTLRLLGLQSLQNSKSLKKPKICKKIFRESKTCVKIDELSVVLNVVYKFQHFKDQKIIESIIDELSELTLLLQTDTKTFFGQSKQNKDQNQQKLQNLGIDVDYHQIKQIKTNILKKQTNCLQSLANLSLGSFCVLSSDQATFFTQLKNQTYKNNIFLNINRETQDSIMENCLAVIQGLCLSSASQNKKSNLQQNKFEFFQQGGCTSNIFQEHLLQQLTQEQKQQLIQQHFGLFGFSFGFNAFKEGPGQMNLNEVGGWYQKLKLNIDSSKTNIRNLVNNAFNMPENNECDCLQQNIKIQFIVGDHSKDFLQEGQNSGIYYRYPELLFVSIGFCFIVLQLFV